MAGEWVKMRSSLPDSPKVGAIADYLLSQTHFRDWLNPTEDRVIIGDDALRCVTVGILLRVWGKARDHGKMVGNDLFMPMARLESIDHLAGVACFGKAMESVGWAIVSGDGKGVTLPNFREYNFALTPAEKQQLYRERGKKKNEEARYGALPTVTLRQDKTRQDNSNNSTAAVAADGEAEVAALKAAGLSPALAQSAVGASDPTLIREVLAYHNAHSSKFRNGPGALRSMLTDPHKWGFSRDDAGWHQPPAAPINGRPAETAEQRKAREAAIIARREAEARELEAAKASRPQTRKAPP